MECWINLIRRMWIRKGCPLLSELFSSVSVIVNALFPKLLLLLSAASLTNMAGIVDPKKQIRLTLAYPASTGRNFPEILRVIDSLQLGDKYRITTPANWHIPDPKTGQVEERVIVHPSVQGEEVKQLFGEDVETVYVSTDMSYMVERVGVE